MLSNIMWISLLNDWNSLKIHRSVFTKFVVGGRSCEGYDALTDINKIFEDELRTFKSRD